MYSTDSFDWDYVRVAKPLVVAPIRKIAIARPADRAPTVSGELRRVVSVADPSSQLVAAAA